MEPGPVSTVPENTPTPDQFEASPRRDLLDALTDAEAILVEDRHAIGPRRTRAELRDVALLALALARALAAVLLRHEWLVQVQALQHGASLSAVATACGLDVDELPAVLRARIDEQVRYDLMPRSAADELLALIDRAAAAEPPSSPA
jgi:hypothetical protein